MLQEYWIVLLSALAAGTWIYFFVKRKLNYWEDRGVPGPRPLPLIGNMHQRMRADLYVKETEWAKQYGNFTMYGNFMGPQPALFVSDIELVKQVLIKDFHPHFINRAKPPVLNKLIQSTLVFADDDTWRRIRTIVSPTFTTGKLRGMHPMMNRSVGKLVSYLDGLSSNAGNVGMMETKKVVAGFTIDVIASCGFATETNANDDRSTENQFVVMGKKLVSMSILKLVAMVILPEFLLRWLGIDSFLPTEPFNYLTKVVRHILVERTDKNQNGKVDRSDLLQMMLDARVEESELINVNYDKLTATDKDAVNSSKVKTKTGKLKKLTEDEIVANCIIFFIGGFETTSSTISHCLFELAHHPDIQELLHHDLKLALDKFDDENSEACFETVINGIPLLEAVIKETLRLYPPILLVTRLCATNGYRLGEVPLEKNTMVGIPVNAIHHNPQLHPDPYRFNPERFMPENKHLLVPYSFLAFADGPRNCLGMRFALQEIKLCLAAIVHKFQFSLTPDTPAKLTFEKGNSMLISTPFPIKVHKR